ncbi:Sec-independent protein translocase TatC [Acidisphaera rubrifaciens HS-AP3]|uniref:Sec-independent protein translocase protein TatC n=2 Tax=Acidisphaera TaxID=50714 RepID=A0A0D6P6U3_9PROT|nr:Sec-independent protein translocase TatC [Acidisphaera rubrifaciens HS-AP3]
MDATPNIEDPINDKPMPLLEHLVELRRRLLYSMVAFLLMFAVSWYFARDIYAFLAAPLEGLLAQRPELQGAIIATGLTRPFLVYLKVAMFGGAFMGFPIFATQIWLFVAPGLYRSEKKALLPFLIATPVLFITGAAIAYYFVFPVAWKFFLSYFSGGGASGALAIKPQIDVNDYLGLVMKLLFAFGLTFEVPVLLTLLARVGIVSSKGLKRARRYAFVGMFVLAAILAPPDVYSQVALALLLVLLYEISIIVARFVEPKPVEA